MKRCSKCDVPKELSEFPKDKSKKDGHYPVCKICRSPLTKASYTSNRGHIREKAKERYAADPDKFRAESKAFQDRRRIEEPEVLRAYHAEYYLTHKDQFKVYAKRRDPQKVRKRRAAYMALKGDQVRAGVRDWFRRNPRIATLNAAKYRMRRSKVENSLTPAQIEETLEFFGYRCGYCLTDLRELSKELQTLDHLRPIARGGSNTQENVVPCCKSCNSRKGSRHIALMARYL